VTHSNITNISNDNSVDEQSSEPEIYENFGNASESNRYSNQMDFLTEHLFNSVFRNPDFHKSCRKMLEDWVYEDVRRGFENNLSFSEERLASSLCDEELFLNASHMLQQRVLQAFSNPNDEGDDIRILPQEAMIKDC
jgi:hypothetical protein